MKYRFGGNERQLALGSSTGVSLKEARVGCDAARKTREAGADPLQKRKVEKLASSTSGATTFEAVSIQLHTVKANAWSASHWAQWLRCMEKAIFHWLGSLPLG